VFECVDRKGELRAICGGGRYDKLLESMGSETMPAVGFGFGDAVIIELLKDKGLLPDFSNNNIQVIAYAMDENLRSRACAIISNLRYKGINIDFILDTRKPKWVFNRADKLGVRKLLIIN
jgi:histidyl-tRNA synthetase